MATGLSTQDKALKINLDSSIYGSFAEIGAGQEVARWFFRAGAASKTVAKTMSAYDMTFSDAIYGPEKSGRYVCESRLRKMLDHEYNLLVERLSEKRGSQTRFFAFADTVAATSFKKNDQEGRGWIGLRFQTHIGGPANEVVMHVRLFDKDALVQQEELGILGVNLIYATYFLLDNPALFLASLTEGIKEQSIEVEMIDITGDSVKHIDNKLLALNLMEQGLTNAVLFGPKGEVLQPSDVLFKKNVIIQRGSFRPFTKLHQDMLNKGKEQFCDQKAGGCDISNTIVVMEMTTKNLIDKGMINHRDFLDRVEMLNALNYHVLISEYFEYFNLRQYLARYTREQVGILMGAIHLSELFNPDHYTDLKGGILEAFGLLFAGPVQLFVYPAKQPDGRLLTLESFQPAKDVQGLYSMLIANKKIVDLKGVDDKFLHIFSRDLSKKIQMRDASWENDVPSEVAQIIKTRKLFL